MRLTWCHFTALMSLALGGVATADDVVYFDENGGGGNPRGLYTLDTVSGIATLRALVGGAERFFSMTVQPSTGRVFAMQVPGDSILWSIDLDTGATTMIANTFLDTIADITFDPRTGDLYGLERNGAYRIFRLDPVTGASTLVGPTNSGARTGLVFSPVGELFAFALSGELFSVDKSTGATTSIGGGGIPSLIEDAVFTSSGELFVVTWAGEVYEIDPNTGANTFVHATGMGSGLTAIVDITACPCACDFDTSTGVGVCDLIDFTTFAGLFAIGDPCACDLDTSTGPGVCDLIDFTTFAGQFAVGCP